MEIGPYHLSEEEYLKRREEELNLKVDGRGTLWVRNWVTYRQELYEPAFIAQFNKTANGIELGNFPAAKYTLVIKTFHTEPGFNAVVARAKATINAEARLVETAHPENVLATVFVRNAAGMDTKDFDFDNGRRVQGAYKYAAYTIGRVFAKKRS